MLGLEPTANAKERSECHQLRGSLKSVSSFRVEGPDPRMIIQLVTGNCFLDTVELKESLSQRAFFEKIKDLVNEP